MMIVLQPLWLIFMKTFGTIAKAHQKQLGMLSFPCYEEIGRGMEKVALSIGPRLFCLVLLIKQKRKTRLSNAETGFLQS